MLVLIVSNVELFANPYLLQGLVPHKGVKLLLYKGKTSIVQAVFNSYTLMTTQNFCLDEHFKFMMIIITQNFRFRSTLGT
jgi:hypothetical protein